MIVLVKYKGISGGLIKGDPTTFEILDKTLNMDQSVQDMMKKHNYGMLFSVKVMQALSHHGFYYLTGGVSTYKLPPLVLVNDNHQFFKCLKQ